MTPERSFPERSFVLARLLLQPLYSEEGRLWDVLRDERESVAHYFRQIGQELVVDEDEGYAFLRQIEIEGDEPVPRIGRRQPLSYIATILMVCLREEYARFQLAPGNSTRLVLTRQELRELTGQFLKESHNQVRDLGRIETAIRRVETLGFLRQFGGAETDSYEVMRIIKARFGSAELEGVRTKLSLNQGEDL
ncbi:MAG: hypothetical protein JWM95_1347 [Gemmatimonadetes bacterium]|nr:hypothetical protein [Gemmatimonadota bacterium]